MAGGKKKAGGFFWGRKRQANADASQESSTVVRPLGRDAGRRAQRDLLPRFHSLASDQFSNRLNDRFTGIRNKLRMAFTPSQPVADQRMFAGRDEALKTLIRAIEDQRLHTVLYGERGIGKTSMLHMVTLAAREARYIVVYTSCGANSTFDEIFRAASADIPLLFHSGFSPTTQEAEKGATLASLVTDEPLSPRKFGDLCSKLTGTRVIIILDEFDRCESGAFRRDVAELIKNLSDRLIRVQLILAGVAADLTELVEHIPSIRRNIYAMRLPRMTDAEVLQIVSNGEREAGLTFDPAAGTSVVAVALGSPYIASLLCHHASHVALDEGRSTVLPRDVSTAIDRTAGEFKSRIPHPLQQRTAHMFDHGQGDALATAARAALSGDGPFGVAELQSYGGVDATRAAQVIKMLTTEGILVPAREDDGAQRVAFVEEGLPIFLWITWAQQNLRPDSGKAARLVKTS